MRPKLLDLFCGAGGAGMGYHRAGFDVAGVDIKPQPNYPFDFHQADALTFPLDGFDAIHASPPCQGYSSHVVSDGEWSHGVHRGRQEPQLIDAVRERLTGSGVPWVIENVRGAADHMFAQLILCGAMFGLATPRHRLFESSALIMSPPHPPCRGLTHPAAESWIAVDPAKRDRRIYSVTGKGRQAGTVKVWRALMDMPWAKRDHELAEAIPPAYTEWIGRQLIRAVSGA